MIREKRITKPPAPYVVWNPEIKKNPKKAPKKFRKLNNSCGYQAIPASSHRQSSGKINSLLGVAFIYFQ